MNHSKTQKMAGLALFTAIVIVLQLIATFVRFGPFSITLTLIPIVVGAAVYGVKSGAYLGGVFGVVVLIASVFGWDAGGNILWNAQPLLTAALCLVKGIAAGLVAGAIFILLSKKSVTAGSITAAVLAPIVNTGIFLLAMYFLYYDSLAAWASGVGASVTTYILTGLVGVNFLLELGVNILISPIIVRIIRASGKFPTA